MESKFNVNIIHSANELSPEELCQSILGKNLSQVVREIQINQDGRFNWLFEEETA